MVDSSHKAGLGLLDDPSLEKPADPCDSVKCEKVEVIVDEDEDEEEEGKDRRRECRVKEEIYDLWLAGSGDTIASSSTALTAAAEVAVGRRNDGNEEKFSFPETSPEVI
ncbi:hypothetical protein M0804_001070 [Polistes exclamans]|nr:hypothetical protein M0804_001070 [Polistes exclamans]